MPLAKDQNRDLSPAIACWSTVQFVASGNGNRPTGQAVVKQAVTSADVGTVNGGAKEVWGLTLLVGIATDNTLRDYRSTLVPQSATL